jgi:hypothetical protein
VDAILKEKSDTEEELDILKNTTCEQIWMRELTKFETEYAKYKTARETLQNPSVTPAKKVMKVVKRIDPKKVSK